MNDLDPWVIRDKDGLQVWMGTHAEALHLMQLARIFGEENGPLSLKQERIVAHEEVE